MRGALCCPAAGSEQGNGYCFDGVDEGSLNSALDRALQAFQWVAADCIKQCLQLLSLLAEHMPRRCITSAERIRLDLSKVILQSAMQR